MKVKIRRRAIKQSLIASVLRALLSVSPAMVWAGESEFMRAIALGDLLYADKAVVMRDLKKFFPDLRHIPSNPLPQRLIGDQYFHVFMSNDDASSAIRCIRIGVATQDALISELGHPLRGNYMEMHTTEMKDVGEHDVIMDCYINFDQIAFNVPFAINYFAQQGYEMDIRVTPESFGGSRSDDGPYRVLFEMPEPGNTIQNIVRGRIEANSGLLMLWFRFVPREQIIG